MSLHNDNALVVALDTSTDMLACAASWIDGQTGEAKLVSGDHMCRRHANVELVNTVDSVLAQVGMDRADVGSYVVGRGPGSFTGVRIGISTAKGLARGANVPLLGVSTLDACAWTAWKAGVRGKLGILAEVYPALYVLSDEGPERQFEREHVVKAAVALDEWRQAADWDQVQLTGDGLVRYGKLLGEDETARCVERDLWWPSGEGLLLAHAAGDGDPARVLPIYTRLSDAEENERKRLGLAESAQSEITGVADELAGLGMDEDMAARLFVVVVGRGVGVFAALIDLAGGNAVTEHFGYIFERHFAPAHVGLSVLPDAVVDPILEVMAVASLVMQPGKAHAVLLALGVVRTAVALVIFRAAPELAGRVLAQVVQQSLPVKAETKAVSAHQVPMMRDGLEMCQRLHGGSSRGQKIRMNLL